MSSSQDPYAQWESLSDSEITVDNVSSQLKVLKDDLWVAAACLDRLVDDAEVQRALLELGLERTRGAVERSKEAAAFLTSPSGDPDEELDSGDTATGHKSRGGNDALAGHLRGVPVDAQLCHIRGVLLERLDRLGTYVEVCSVPPEADAEEEDEGMGEGDDWEDDPWADEAESSTAPKATKSSRAIPPISLPSFLIGDLTSSACLLASHEWFAALALVLKRHASALWPFRFTILDAIPEYPHPSQYSDILPSLDFAAGIERKHVSEPWRAEVDWVEIPDVQQAIAEATSDLARQPVLNAGPHPDPLTVEELSRWYKDRVDRIISATGMVDISLAIIQHGASQGIPDLDQLGEDLSLLARLVYDAPQPDTDDGMDGDWTLARWHAMEPHAVVQAYLAHSTPDTLAKDIARLVMPYLYVLESRAERAGAPDPLLPQRMLYDYVLTAPLEKVAAIFEASKPTLPAAQRLIRNDEDIARLALACLYGSSSVEEWATMSRIFECLPAWELRAEDEEEEAADTTVASLGAFVTPSTARPHCTAADLLVFFTPLPQSSLSRALDILDVHLESGEILARWSVPAPCRWFLQSSNSVSEQRAWANRMARRAGGLEDQLNTQEDWEWLLEDMLKLSGKGENGLRGAFGLLDRKEITRIFFGGLLSSGNFGIAKGLLQASRSKLSLDTTAIEDICLSASSEFYDNANSGNYKVGDMKLAYECLDVPPPSERITKEKEFIEATSRLSSFNVMSRPGVPISPIEIRLTKDRLSLVSRVLSSNSEAYKHTEVILDLVYKLGFRGDPVAEVKTLAMLADTALQAEDFERAYETSERMVALVLELRAAPYASDDPKVGEASEVCWVACYQLGRQSEFDDVDKKMRLLGRALELCPADQLHDVLTSWRRLEREDIDLRKERLEAGRSGVAIAPSPSKRVSSAALIPTATLRARLQDFHMPSPPLLSTPDAAALASKTFRSVAATFPFSIGSRGRSQASQPDDARSQSSLRWPQEGVDVSATASRAFSKGVGWLIGADEQS